MADTAALTRLHRAVDEMRRAVESVQESYGDIPAVRRLHNDVDRLQIDAAELGALTPLVSVGAVDEIQVLDDTPPDPALWAGADDEGLGGYHR